MRRQRSTLGKAHAAATRGTTPGARATGGSAAFPAPEAAQAAHTNATAQAGPTPRTPQSDRAARECAIACG
jgi:hypothetical protein